MNLAGGRGVYSIGAVARMLGIPAATIRNWEERYGTIVPERSPGATASTRATRWSSRASSRRRCSRPVGADAHRCWQTKLKVVNPGERRSKRWYALLVLLAERDPVAADLAEFFLRTEGYEVHLALAVATPRSSGSRAARSWRSWS